MGGGSYASVVPLRAATFNLHGAFVPGKAGAQQQARSWHRLASYGTTLGLLQEVGHAQIPPWVHDRWSVVAGQIGTCGKSFGWGSAIVADPALNLRPRPDLLVSHPWLCLLYDYLIVAEIDLPDGSPALVASIHAPAVHATEVLELVGSPGAISEDDLAAIAQPGDAAWAVDVIFEALRLACVGKQFIAGGDLNTSRLFDSVSGNGKITNALFFARAAKAGWHDCHGDWAVNQAAGVGKLAEERTYLKPGTRPFQLDHLFCDRKTAKSLTRCWVDAGGGVEEMSDHAPLLADFADAGSGER